MTRTILRGGTVIGFQDGEHRLLEGGDVIYSGDTIEHVGRPLADTSATIIDVSGKLVLPGLISTHAHVGCGTGDRLIVDTGRRDFLRIGGLALGGLSLPALLSAQSTSSLSSSSRPESRDSAAAKTSPTDTACPCFQVYFSRFSIAWPSVCP